MTRIRNAVSVLLRVHTAPGRTVKLCVHQHRAELNFILTFIQVVPPQSVSQRWSLLRPQQLAHRRMGEHVLAVVGR